mgnify:CR=1 FL=1
MNQINYQKSLERVIDGLENRVPSLLLHSCCGPCSTYCIEYLSSFFNITVFYYNPNIYPDNEYLLRVKEQKAFIDAFPTRYPVSFLEGDFDKERFYEVTKGMENEPERGKRCEKCIGLRLTKTAQKASELGFDYFTTTLSVSPLKDACLINSLGYDLENSKEISSKWLPCDFKKKSGYLRSCELSKEYNMYRQDYCGCVFSYNQRHNS